MPIRYDLWYSEHDTNAEDSIPGTLGTLVRPPHDSDLSENQKRCPRCGVVRVINLNRAIPPLCRDCKGSLTEREQRKWI